VNDRCSGKALSAQPFEQSTRKRRVMKQVRLAEEDSHEKLIAIEYSHRASSSAKQQPSRQHSVPPGCKRTE
jgi:hypothetical protein